LRTREGGREGETTSASLNPRLKSRETSHGTLLWTGGRGVKRQSSFDKIVTFSENLGEVSRGVLRGGGEKKWDKTQSLPKKNGRTGSSSENIKNWNKGGQDDGKRTNVMGKKRKLPENCGNIFKKDKIGKKREVWQNES